MNELKMSVDDFRMIIGQQEIEKFDLWRKIVVLNLKIEELQKDNERLKQYEEKYGKLE